MSERIDPDLHKVELHLHLEGAAPPAFIRGLAQEKKAGIAGIFDAQGNYSFADFGGVCLAC
jgi:adenosine deaminase